MVIFHSKKLGVTKGYIPIKSHQIYVYLYLYSITNHPFWGTPISGNLHMSFHKWGTPIAGWFNFGKSYENMDDDWGYPHDLGNHILTIY